MPIAFSNHVRGQRHRLAVRERSKMRILSWSAANLNKKRPEQKPRPEREHSRQPCSMRDEPPARDQKNRVSDNAGAVKHFLSILLQALRRARHFALVEGSAIPTKARS